MARLSTIKTLASFDFSFQPSLDKNRIMALAELKFIDRTEVLHLVGPPGTGKSHLSLALGVEAIKADKMDVEDGVIWVYGSATRARWPSPTSEFENLVNLIKIIRTTLRGSNAATATNSPPAAYAGWIQLDPEDGRLTVLDLGEDGTSAFTRFGIDILADLVQNYKANPNNTLSPHSSAEL